MLAKRHWQTAEEAEMHYVSELLGGLEKEGYKFFYPGAPSEWPDDYLNSVISHRLSVQALRLTQKWEAETNQKPLDVANALDISTAEKEKAKELSRGMGDHFRRLETAKASHQAMSGKGNS